MSRGLKSRWGSENAVSPGKEAEWAVHLPASQFLLASQGSLQLVMEHLVGLDPDEGAGVWGCVCMLLCPLPGCFG